MAFQPGGILANGYGILARIERAFGRRGGKWGGGGGRRVVIIIVAPQSCKRGIQKTPSNYLNFINKKEENFMGKKYTL